jgi:hypothetical protein
MVPIIKKEEDRERVMAAVAELEAACKAAGIRAKVRVGSGQSSRGSNAELTVWPWLSM